MCNLSLLVVKILKYFSLSLLCTYVNLCISVCVFVHLCIIDWVHIFVKARDIIQMPSTTALHHILRQGLLLNVVLTEMLYWLETIFCRHTYVFPTKDGITGGIPMGNILSVLEVWT